jgi:hypothetical protein
MAAADIAELSWLIICLQTKVNNIKETIWGLDWYRLPILVLQCQCVCAIEAQYPIVVTF